MAQLTTNSTTCSSARSRIERRIAVMRRGTEYVIVPSRLAVERGREAIQARHPGGNVMLFFIDELESVEVVK